jgi:hypothetical protein
MRFRSAEAHQLLSRRTTSFEFDFAFFGLRTLAKRCMNESLHARLVINDRDLRRHAACSTRKSISLRSVVKSMGLVRSASAPFSSALRFVSASRGDHDNWDVWS